MELAIVGSEKFSLGFMLSGIRNIFETEKNPEEILIKLIEEKKFGIVVVEEELLQEVDEFTRQRLLDSAKPVFIGLSEKAEDTGLRRLIKKSIGIDLWEN